MKIEQYEIDFLPVGDGSRSGDAIALRFGNNFGSRNQEQVVAVVDGGTKESGAALVEHIQTHYGTDEVDLVLATHTDDDHVSGLHVVLEKLEVGSLSIHQPWKWAKEIHDQLDDDRRTVKGTKTRAQKGLQQAFNLVELAKSKHVGVTEPFAGMTGFDGAIRVLGPTEAFYKELLPDFRCIAGSVSTAGLGAQAEITQIESWSDEKLQEPRAWSTSAENNSSLILLLQLAGHKLLLTGDAGVEALNGAVAEAGKLGISLHDLRFIQIPHHGSRRNVGPKILDKILGPKVLPGVNGKTAFVSVSAGASPKHPSKRVVNAFIRRGATVAATTGRGLVYKHNVPFRPNYGPLVPLGFCDRYQEIV